MEMTGEQVGDRMASIISKVPFRYVRHPETANASQAEEINRGYLALAELPLHIYERATMQLTEIVASMRYHILRKGAKLVGVDYAQRILVPNQKEVRLQVSEVAKQLAVAVKGTPSHLMLLSQLKRRHDGGIPSISDLRESGQLENDAHNVLLLWREGRQDEYGTAAKIIVAKSRFGFTGTVNATFNKDFAVFEDATNAAVQDT
jgi:replicative DNA helicase